MSITKKKAEKGSKYHEVAWFTLSLIWRSLKVIQFETDTHPTQKIRFKSIIDLVFQKICHLDEEQRFMQKNNSKLHQLLVTRESK